MKKKYVNLKIQIVKVQLSDCIASSVVRIRFYATRSSKAEIDGRGGDLTTFDTW